MIQVTAKHIHVLQSIQHIFCKLPYSDFHCHFWYNQPIYHTYKYNLFRMRLKRLQHSLRNEARYVIISRNPIRNLPELVRDKDHTVSYPDMRSY